MSKEINKLGLNDEKSINPDKLTLSQATYLLKIFYSLIIDILDAFCGGNIGFWDEGLDVTYQHFKLWVDSLLNFPELKELKDKKPSWIIQSMVGELEEIDSHWKFTRNKYLEFHGQIANYCNEYRTMNYKLSDEIIKSIDLAREMIDRHKKIDDREFAKYFLRIRKQHKGTEMDPGLPSFLKTLYYKGLNIDREKGILEYKDSGPIKIEVNNQTIKFLIMLMFEHGAELELENIGKNVFDEINPKLDDVRSRLPGSKRDLLKYLKRQGLSADYVEELRTMIESIPSGGYRLN